jgi:hypothetical protein
MEKFTINPGQVIDVNGVVLNEKSIQFLLSLQSQNNGGLNEIFEFLNGSVSLLILSMEYQDEKLAGEMLDHSKYLISLNRGLKELMSPN